MKKYQANIPNYLTMFRVVLIPFLILSFYLENGTKYVSSGIFIIASITDYFDGYLSRRWQVQSKLGELMDPIADKLLVTTALALIIAADNSHLIPAVGIMCREIFISGLREFTAKQELNLPVTNLAKWKTAIQMLAMVILLTVADQPEMIAFYVGSFFLWIAFALTLYTGFLYFVAVKESGVLKGASDK